MQRFFIDRLILALAFAVLALLISPIGIKLITGREDLTFRVSLLGLCFAAFLLVLAIAIASIGRLRQLMFYVFVIMLPVIFFAVLETAAIALHLADRVALAEDNSVYERRGRWPAHLMSDARMFNTDGLRLYRPWQGDGVVINDLGLRTQRPQTKQTGEWRIAITGGSTAWGWRVGDEDTIAAQLARALQRHGYKNVSVYNFGIEGAELKSELALLKRFKEIYAIDQAIFYTGGNNVGGAYMHGRPWLNQATGFTSLELFKAWTRLAARLNSPAANAPDFERPVTNATVAQPQRGNCSRYRVLSDCRTKVRLRSPALVVHPLASSWNGICDKTYGRVHVSRLGRIVERDV